MNRKEMTCYETDASQLSGEAQKVVFPKNTGEIENIVKISDDLVSRGGGTGLVGGCVPDDSVVVDLSGMNKILDFNGDREIVYVESGITIKELNEKLMVIGFEFPIQPLNQAATLGGMVAVNASDFRSFKYGKMKDWVEEIEFVNGRGELMKTSKTDISDICGMEGITGIIARIKLRVIKKRQRSFSVFQSSNLDGILSIARRLRTDVSGQNFSEPGFKACRLT